MIIPSVSTKVFRSNLKKSFWHHLGVGHHLQPLEIL